MNCDRLAPWYQFLERVALGGALQRRREAYLPLLTESERVLLLGDGDGRFLQKLMETRPGIQADSIDSSAVMLRLARDRVGPTDRVRFHIGDARVMALPEGPFSLISTHFFLDCLSQSDVEQIVARLSGVTKPGSRWLVSEFQTPAEGFARFWTPIYVGLLYRIFRVLTGLRVNRLPHYRDALRNGGWICERREQSAGGLLVSELWRRLPTGDTDQR